MVPGRGLLTLLGALAHTTEAFLPSDEYAATLHLTEGTCVAAGAAWVAGLSPISASASLFLSLPAHLCSPG